MGRGREKTQVRRRFSTVSDETLDLRSILLQEVPLPEFSTARQFWGLNHQLADHAAYARIDYPWRREGVAPEDYERLLWLCTEVEGADEIFVRGQKGTIKRYARKVTGPELQEMAALAASDKLKINYLELHLKREAREIKCPRACISFTEWQGTLVGYKVDFPRSLESLFSFDSLGPYWRTYALWMPEEIRTERYALARI